MACYCREDAVRLDAAVDALSVEEDRGEDAVVVLLVGVEQRVHGERPEDRGDDLREAEEVVRGDRKRGVRGVEGDRVDVLPLQVQLTDEIVSLKTSRPSSTGSCPSKTSAISRSKETVPCPMKRRVTSL
jgi:hypothetical protein